MSCFFVRGTLRGHTMKPEVIHKWPHQGPILVSVASCLHQHLQAWISDLRFELRYPVISGLCSCWVIHASPDSPSYTLYLFLVTECLFSLVTSLKSLCDWNELYPIWNFAVPTCIWLASGPFFHPQEAMIVTVVSWRRSWTGVKVKCTWDSISVHCLLWKLSFVIYLLVY